MIDRDDLLDRVIAANPLPSEHPLPDGLDDWRPPLAILTSEETVVEAPDRPPDLPMPDFGGELLSTERSRIMDTQQRPEVQETTRRAGWRTAAIAFAAIILVVGAVVGMAALIRNGADDVAGSGDEPTYAYELNGTLEEEGGGPAAVALGGTVGADGYSFDRNEGLALNVDLGKDYTIETRLRIDDPGGIGEQWAKILDFRDLADDGGLYLHNTENLLFAYRRGGGPYTPVGIWEMGTFHTIRLVRDGEAGTVTVYLDDQLQTWSRFEDGSQVGDTQRLETINDSAYGEALQGGKSMLHVMVDDHETRQKEAAPGEIDYIRITIP